MNKQLPKKLRARWDALIANEGAALGLSGCKVFLENTLANDIFYRGLFKGKPCVVKCSSRSPESIRTEYDMSRCLFAVDPTVCAEPLAFWQDADGQKAFVVMRRLTGPTLREQCAQGCSEVMADRVAEDMYRIARALETSGIVHRDFWVDNVLLDGDGHYKLIDFQFSLKKGATTEHSWLKRNWKMRLLIFGYNSALPLGCWNDICGMRNCLRQLPQTEVVKRVDSYLQERESAADFFMPVTICERFLVRMYRISLLIQRLLRSSSSPKRGALDRRLRHIRTRLSAVRSSMM